MNSKINENKNTNSSADNIFISAFIMSLILAKDLSIEEQGILGNYLQIVGLNLTSYATFCAIYDSENPKNNNEN